MIVSYAVTAKDFKREVCKEIENRIGYLKAAMRTAKPHERGKYDAARGELTMLLSFVKNVHFSFSAKDASP